jgi:hypothetical protein
MRVKSCLVTPNYYIDKNKILFASVKIVKARLDLTGILVLGAALICISYATWATPLPDYPLMICYCSG